MKMGVEIVNMVATVFLNTEINIESLKNALETFGRTIYDPDRFPGLIVKTGKGISLLVFRTGKIVIAGAKSVDEVKRVIKEFLNHVKGKLGKIPSSVEVQIQNIVATANLGKHVNLEELAQKIPNVLYEPEQFPGAIVRVGLSKPVVLVFSTGKVVLVGGRDEEDIVKTYEKLKEIIG